MVTVGAQLLIVRIVVVETIEVVYETLGVEEELGDGEDEPWLGDEDRDTELELELEMAVVIGRPGPVRTELELDTELEDAGSELLVDGDTEVLDEEGLVSKISRDRS